MTRSTPHSQIHLRQINRNALGIFLASTLRLPFVYSAREAMGGKHFEDDNDDFWFDLLQFTTMEWKDFWFDEKNVFQEEETMWKSKEFLTLMTNVGEYLCSYLIHPRTRTWML